VARGAMMQGTIQIDRASFDDLRAAWASLLPAAVTPFPFQSIEWAESWWSVFGAGNELLLLRATDEQGRVIGIAPLMLTTTALGRTIQFIGGAEVTDYLDIVATEGDLAAAWAAILDHLLAKRDEWDAIDLHCLPQWSPSHATVADQLSGTLAVEIGQEEVCPIVRLAGSFEAYLRALPKKERHEVRRKARNFERDAPTGRLRVITDKDDALAAMPDFLRLHRLSAPDKERFLTPEIEQFFAAMTAATADAGWLRLYLMEIDDAPVAAVFTFVADGRMLVYNSGYDPAYAHVSAGMVLVSMMIEDAARLGLAVFDFLRGNEAYKYRFGATDTPIWRVIAAPDADTVHAEMARMEAALRTPADQRDLAEEERARAEGAE
jgi:CelD/BcsL family acetyltransferase involved in cellulose biosynthesis